MNPSTSKPLAARRAGACLLALALPCAAHAFDGQLVGADGAPIAGAEVAVLSHGGGAVRTDVQGRFSWRPDPTPPFELLVILPGGRGLRPIRFEALPAAGEPLRVAVEAIEESVTVTSGSTPGIQGAPASATALLSAREFGARQPANLAQLLENVAGVASVSEGQAAVPAIRGLARGRTLILVDGARVSSERRVGPSATYLDPATLESVEVSRGPATVAYGSDAFGGVINARTRAAPPGSGFGGRLAGSFGEGVPERRTSLELRRGFATGGVLVQGHWRESGDYDSPAGAVFNSGYRDFGWRARAERYSSSAVLSLAFQSDLGRDVERPRDNSRTTRFLYPAEDSHRLTVSYEAAGVAGFGRLGGHAFFGTYALVTEQDRAPSATRPRSVERADVAARDFHVRGFGQRALGRARLELGLDVNGRFGLEAFDVTRAYRRDGAFAGEQVHVSVDDARRTDAALYATLEAALRRSVTVSGGLRLDRVATRNTGGFFGDRATTHTAAAGFAALRLRPAEGLTLTAQAARGFRDPTLSDRYYRGPTGRGFVTGNPELQPETSRQFDLGARYVAGRWRAELHGYHYRFHDLVERYQAEPDFFFFRNRGRARLHGLELELGCTWGQLSLALTAHGVRGEADDGTELDDVPPDTLTFTLRREFSGRGFLQLRGGFYARDARPGPTEQAREGHALVDASGGLRLRERLELRLLLRNVLDREYLVSPDARAVFAPGRAALLSAALDF